MDIMPTENSVLSEVIDNLLRELAGYDGHSEEYAKIVKQLDLLYKMKALDHDFTIKSFNSYVQQRTLSAETQTKSDELMLKKSELEKPDRVSKDVLATVAANIAAVFLVIGYERAHVVTTKALGFIMKR
jgi:hypothetical protein